MKITFSPMRRDDRLVLHRDGDVLTINGEAFDFGPLPDGATLPRTAIDCDWIAGPVERIEGVLHIHLILPHGAEAPMQTLYPDPMTLIADGAVDLPPHSTPEPETPYVED